jgi:hypothetical protein
MDDGCRNAAVSVGAVELLEIEVSIHFVIGAVANVAPTKRTRIKK